jgi:hypothetical protein
MLPALLAVCAAVVLIVYGAAFHSKAVLVERKLELPASMFPEGLPPGQFPGLPAIPDTEIVPLDQSEPHLIREVTVGGVTRLENGRLQRTYVGEAPSACPT